MSKKVFTSYDLNDPVSLQRMENDVASDLIDIQVNIYPQENAIEAFYKGKPFETTNCEHSTLDDRVLMDPAVHGNIETKELRLMGTVFQINSLGNPYPQCNTAKYPILPDYIMWTALNPDPIKVQFDLTGEELFHVIPDSITRHAIILQHLRVDKNIQIIDDGYSSLGYSIDLQNPSPTSGVNFIGIITVMLDIGFPQKVNDIIESVETYKSDLYQTIRIMHNPTNNNP